MIVFMVIVSLSVSVYHVTCVSVVLFINECFLYSHRLFHSKCSECIKIVAEDICQESRVYDYAKLGLPLNKVAHFVELNFYPDKELLVSFLFFNSNPFRDFDFLGHRCLFPCHHSSSWDIAIRMECVNRDEKLFVGLQTGNPSFFLSFFLLSFPKSDTYFSAPSSQVQQQTWLTHTLLHVISIYLLFSPLFRISRIS